MQPNIFLNRFVDIGIIKVCSYCSFRTTERKEIRRHGLDIHNNKNCQKNDKKYQMEHTINAK